MNPAELPLRDIHLPAEPGFWPLAPGWWLLLALGAGLLLWAWLRWRQAQKRKARQQAVLNVLDSATSAYRQSGDAHRLAQDLSELLRRYVRHVVRDPQATTLQGRAWAGYLAGLLPEKTDKSAFLKHIQAIENAAFNPAVSSQQAQQWIDSVRLIVSQPPPAPDRAQPRQTSREARRV